VFTLVAIISIALAALYAALLIYFTIGWLKLKRFSPKQASQPQSAFSIIIPARNERDTIIPCLTDIVNQQYPLSQYEIIIVDDFSEDETCAKVIQFINDNPGCKLKLIKLADEKTTEQNSFKKAAITIGINHASFDWIITSDADCRHGSQWLQTIHAFIGESNPVLVSAPVSFIKPTGFFQKMQALEFAGLIGIGASSIAQNTPNMCNGANLIYKKQAFFEVDGFSGYNDFASGDDEFLLHKMHSKWPDRLFFLKNQDATAYTNPVGDLNAFIQQRKRWVSKSRKYARKSITAILTGAWLFHFCLLFTLAAACFDVEYIWIFVLAFAIKLVAEFGFLLNVTRFFRQSNHLWLLLPAAYLYIYYVLIIGIYGNFGRYEWKGRVVR
jgi:cellulose synthase/poly-beta-1,6-N-acetylglucosamine synthase-like glycosyltransferase